MEKHEKHHGKWMLILCIVPMLAIGILPRLGLNLGPFANLISLGVVLICPLMHLGMMTWLFKGKGGGCCGDHSGDNEEGIQS